MNIHEVTSENSFVEILCPDILDFRPFFTRSTLLMRNLRIYGILQFKKVECDVGYYI